MAIKIMTLTLAAGASLIASPAFSQLDPNAPPSIRAQKRQISQGITLKQEDVFLNGTPHEFKVDFVEIGNAGNKADVSGYGTVNYNYRIGTYEVSEHMIHAYNEGNSGTSLDISMDSRTQNSPATNITWNEAARFVNWLNTISGYPKAYKFTTGGVNDNISLWEAGDDGFNVTNRFRNSKAHYFLPSEDEWNKAAYYDPESGTYFDYATGSNTIPTTVAGGTMAGTAVYAGQYGGAAHIKNAGGRSPYGTMAQSGNVWEWGESAYNAPNDIGGEWRRVHGGDFATSALTLRASTRYTSMPIIQRRALGFRIASISQIPLTEFVNRPFDRIKRMSNKNPLENEKLSESELRKKVINKEIFRK